MQRSILVFSSQRNKHWFILNMLWPGFVSLLSFALLQPFMHQCSATMKRRLRVDFEMDNKRSRHDVVSVHFGLSRRQCMMKCAADTRCTAFNFLSADGVCELLPELRKCYEPDDDDHFTFTQLKIPDSKPPMAKQSKPLDTNDLQWVPCNSTTASSSSNIQVKDEGYVALVFNKGMYLPAHWQASQGQLRFFYPPDNKAIRCHHGYVLSVQTPEQYQWAFFQIGNPIPTGTMSAGTHVDATPLYIVRIRCVSGKRSGFYSSSFRRAYVSCRNPLYPNGDIEILLHGRWCR